VYATLAGASAAEPKASHDTIREAAARRGIQFGSSFDQFVDWEPAYANLLRGECSILTTDYSLKFGPVRADPGLARFEKPNKLLAFAERAGSRCAAIISSGTSGFPTGLGGFPRRRQRFCSTGISKKWWDTMRVACSPGM
jgi:hypothetical protein